MPNNIAQRIICLLFKIQHYNFLPSNIAQRMLPIDFFIDRTIELLFFFFFLDFKRLAFSFCNLLPCTQITSKLSQFNTTCFIISYDYRSYQFGKIQLHLLVATKKFCLWTRMVDSPSWYVTEKWKWFCITLASQ